MPARRTSAAAAPSTVDSPAACACFNARNAARAITDFYDQELADSGIRITQFAILTSIHLAAGATMQQVAGDLGLDPSTMTRTLRPLEDAGLVAVGTGGDRRAKELSLTARGQRKLGECHQLWKEAQRRLRGRLGADVFDRMLADLGTVNTVLRPMRSPS